MGCVSGDFNIKFWSSREVWMVVQIWKTVPFRFRLVTGVNGITKESARNTCSEVFLHFESFWEWWWKLRTPFLGKKALSCKSFCISICFCNRLPQTGWRNQPHFIVSWFWRLEVWSEGVAGPCPLWNLEREILPGLILASWGWLSVLVSSDLHLLYSDLCLRCPLVLCSLSLSSKEHQSYWTKGPPYSDVTSSYLIISAISLFLIRSGLGLPHTFLKDTTWF